ncbi:ice-binding family protein [Flavobacterium frigoris]|uniref:Ig-like domain-containing protein n=2 Tax=Flavobacterium frigoris TaxID=229204 RepID=I3QNZ9_FLAFI|nr:ice-binding family protein [Flavobacterium frigoris]AFK13197.1 hypothetical protein [Flavobacterium frigoris]EIA08539.1 hypothetical protein HJ01_02261 [Flavobacterium frigoris PS1]
MVKKLLFFIVTYLITGYSYSQTPDFKIQHLQFDVPGSGLTITAPKNFSAVNDLSKSFIIVSNNRRNGAGPIGSSASIEARGMSCSVYFSNANTIVFSRGTGANIITRVNIMIVEYLGSVGGPNEIIVRYRNAVTPVAGTAVQSLIMSTIPGNINKCIPFYSVQTTDTQNGGAANSLMLYCSGTNTLNYHRGGATNTVSARVEVVEFTGSNWSVGHGDSGTGGSDSGTITLNSSATGTGGNIFDVGSYSNAFIWHTYKGDSGSGSNESIVDNYPVYTPNGTTKVNWSFANGHAGASERHFVHVLVNSNMNVTRFLDSQNSENESVIDISTADLTDLGQSLILGSSTSTGGGTAYGRGWRNYYFNSLNQAAHWSHRSGNTMLHEIQIIDFIGLSKCPYIIKTTPSSRCGSGTLVLNAKASAGTIKWYATATDGLPLGTGASFTTPIISTTTTYYVDATNNGCTSASRTAVLATIKEIPTIIETTPGSRVGSGTVNLGASASAGTINWYTSSIGGTIIGTGTSFITPSISSTTTYYAEATSNGCDSSTRIAVIAAVSCVSASSDTRYERIINVQIGAINNSSGVSSGGYGDYSNLSTNVDIGNSYPIIVTNGITDVDSQVGVWVDWNQNGNFTDSGENFTTTRVADKFSANIVAPVGASLGSARMRIKIIYTSTLTPCGTTPYGEAEDYTLNVVPIITGVTSNSRCGTGQVTLGAAGTLNSLTNWYSAPYGDTSLASGTSFKTGYLTNTTSYWVDATYKGFTTSSRTVVIATVNTVPTITGITAATRCGTGMVTLGATASAGIINWYADLTGGASLATGNSYMTPSISATTTYYVDATNNGCTTATRTAVVAAVNAVPTSTAGSAISTCTGLTSIAMTGATAGGINNGNTWSGGGGSGAWSQNANPALATFTPTTSSGSFTALLTVEGSGSCTGTNPTSTRTITWGTTPTSTAGNAISTCTGLNAITMTGATAGGTYSGNTWSGGVGSGAWSQNANPALATFTPTTSSGSFTAILTVAGSGSCSGTNPISTRTITWETPPAITSTKPGSRCGTGTVTLEATASAGTINWYADLTGGASLGTGISFTTVSISATATYYVEAINNGCTTATRTAVVAAVNAVPTITNTIAGSRVGTGTVTLGATASVGVINWYAAASGGVSLGSGESFDTPTISSTTSYYAEVTNGVCTTLSRTEVVASVTIEVSGPLLDLGILTNFAAYTVAGAVTNSGTSTLSGDIGSNNGIITGFGAPTTAGTIYNADATTAQAKIDLLRVYIHLNDVFVTNTTHAAGFGGETLTAGVYSIAGAGSLTGPITLDGQGNANAIFIIKFEGAFTVAANSKIILANGARACNVFWIAQGAISAGASSDLKGTLIAYPGAITVPTGSNLEGRMLSSSGAINFGPGALSVPEGPITIPIKCDNTCNNNILGTVANFVLFTSAGAVANNGPSGIVGDIGSNEGAISGFESSTIEGSFYNVDAVTAQAKIDLQAAYTQLIGVSSTNTTHTPAFGGGETLTAGVYSIGGAGSLAGTLTLDGQGDPDALFILRFTGAFATAAQSKVILTNGVRRCNVFWVADGAISMGAFSNMKGTLIANNGANNMGANGNLEGRMLSTAGAIGISTGVIYNNTLCFNAPINKWKGTVSTVWNIPGNWTRNIVPAADDNIIFDEAPVNHCFMYQDRSVTNITNTQSLYGVVLNGNKLTLKGELLFTNGASIDASAANSTIQLSGSKVQTINSSEFKNNEVYNLNINNSNNLLLSGSLRLLNKLTTTTGLIDAFTNSPVMIYGGSTIQTIGSNQFLGEKVYNLTVDNAIGVNLNTNFTIANTLLINANKIVSVSPLYQLTAMGTINNNAGASGLVLKSDATGTASLLHNSNNVPATVQRYISGPVEGWHFLSSPVSNQSISGSWLPVGSYGTGNVATGTGYDLYLWDEPSFSFKYKQDASSIGWNSVHPGSNFSVGRGYLYSVQAANPTKEFQGNLNNGTINYPITTTATADPILIELKGFNLVGNPYPSSVDWQATSGWDRTILESSAGGKDMWVWNPTANNYGVFNSVSGVGTNSISRYLAPMQGYFVKAASNGAIGFDNSVRTHTGAGNWFKNSGIKNGVIRIDVQSEDNSDADEVLIQFGYSDSKQGASKLFSHVVTAPSLYMRSNSVDYSVRYMTNTAENTSVPLKFKAGKDGFYNLAFNFDSKEFDFVKLEDRILKKYATIKPATFYRFKSSKKDDVNRFVLHFTDLDTAVENELTALVYMDGSRLVVDLKAVNIQTELLIFDITGKLLLQKDLDGSTVHKLDLNLTTQVLLVSLSNEKGTFNTKVLYDSLK